MCGISGVWNYAEAAPVDRAVLGQMTHALRHRGPDDVGFHYDDAAGFGLGFRRLSILDLSPAGRQPMPNEDGSVWVVANGEIYNFADLRDRLIARGHRFRSRCDAEVIVHAYEEHGIDCIADLNGMFALAIWDATRRRLVLARDRVGEKPLYLYDDGRRLLFASELKALLADRSVPRELDWAAAGEFFSAGYVAAPRSILRGIGKLAPAHRLVLESGRVAVARYWDWLPRFQAEETARDAGEYAEELRVALRDAVRRRMVSDVPIGAFLSGGLDSSTVVALMAELSPTPVRTFSVGFAQPAFDESPHARAVAQHLGTTHHELVVQPETALDVLPGLLAHYDEPFADSSAIPTFLVAQLARKHVTVCLSGDGGDETCAGYHHHLRSRYEAAADWLPAGVRRPVLHPLAALPIGVPGQRLARRLMDDPPQRYAAVMSIMPPEQRRGLLSANANRRLAANAVDSFSDVFRRAAELDWLSRLQFCDATVYLPDDILVKVDRASMRVALEVRCPFLDPHVMEVAARVPARLRQSRRRGKLLLREAMRARLPDAILRRPKAGFAVPLHDWMAGPMGTYADAVLRDRRTAERGVFAAAAVDRLLRRRRRFTALSTHVFALLAFELWCRTYLDGCSPPAAAAVG